MLIATSRKADLWNRIISGDKNDLPIPQDRMELLIKSLIDGSIENLPIAYSRKEQIMLSIINGENYNGVVNGKEEAFLKCMIDSDIEGLPTPSSKVQFLMDYIVRNGCLEKFEYYPFVIWNYLNVKNTPKAKMKLKGMKGNTLVLNSNNEVVAPGSDGARMKSFGESENKIEVLSDNNLQGELKQSSKSTLMYRNSSNELVPVPVLRGKWENGKFLWGDEVLEHEDGKLYYHKRCEEYLLNGTEPWMLFPGDSTNPRSFYYSLLPGYKFLFDFMVDNRPMIKSKTQDGCWRFDSTDIKIAISDNQSKFATIPDFLQHIKEKNLRVILQLPYEEVYQCELSEQLYSYDNETNIFINGGDVVGETTIEAGAKLGPIVYEARKEATKAIDCNKYVLAGDMQSLAMELYPQDFENAEVVNNE